MPHLPSLTELPCRTSKCQLPHLPCPSRRGGREVTLSPAPGNGDKSSHLSFVELSVFPPDVDQISWAGTNSQGQETGIFPRSKHLFHTKSTRFLSRKKISLFVCVCVCLSLGGSIFEEQIFGLFTSDKDSDLCPQSRPLPTTGTHKVGRHRALGAIGSMLYRESASQKQNFPTPKLVIIAELIIVSL